MPFRFVAKALTCFANVFWYLRRLIYADYFIIILYPQEPRLPRGDAREGRQGSAAVRDSQRLSKHSELGAETQARQVSLPLRRGHGVPLRYVILVILGNIGGGTDFQKG